jgi:hypothetical protein
MQQAGTSTLFLFTAVVQASLAAFAFTRLGKRAAPATADKTEFDLAATAPLGGVVSPEPLDPNDPNVATPPDADVAPNDKDSAAG